jgi:predicted nucleic acid-binding protein
LSVVIDSSVVIAALVDSGPHGDWAEEVLASGSLHAPEFPFEPFASRIWELRHKVTSYDAWYLAIAEALELPLATLDEPLSKSNAATCKFLTPGF